MPPQVLQGLDRDVYQIIRKFEDEIERDNEGLTHKKQPKFTVSGVYDAIKRSNSSVARQKKRVLEDSIEKVLRLRKAERIEDDDEAALEEASAEPPKQDGKGKDYSRLLNKQMTKGWNVSRRERPASPEAPAATETGAESTATERQPNGEPKAKRRRAEKPKDDRSPPSDISLSDLGGMDAAIQVLAETIALPMHHPQIAAAGIEPARGVLLHGPPGCGKTMLAKAFAADLGVAFIPVSAPSLVAGMSGESEKKIRELYEEAKKLAPCLIFIDEIDAIMGKRENAQREMEKRIVAQMLTCMDDLDPESMGGKVVATIAATNRPDSIDPALRRAGRFNREVSLGIPNEKAREAILKKILQKCRVAEEMDYHKIARRTPGFVGADLKDVVSTAQSDLMRDLMSEIISLTAPAADMDVDGEEPQEQLSAPIRLIRSLAASKGTIIPEEKMILTMDYIMGAVAKVQPSSKREGFTTIPDTTWAHVGSLHDVREQLELAIVKPIQKPEMFAKRGLEAPSGVLLWGPPGCGKTLLAKAVANESKANFISVKGPELLNKYVGESERSVRQVFSRARASAPCILFFDELDALVPRRDGTSVDASARVVNQLLTELDGMGSRAGVYVVGATNRPDMIDPAILRPGRLGTNIFVDLPDADGRADILQTRMRRLLPSYDNMALLDRVARDGRCEGFSGADLDNLHVAAGNASVQREESGESASDTLTEGDWEIALQRTRPSVSPFHAEKFRSLKETGWE
ncbi:ribosome biogenesis ATPase [Microdochium nivale]|nr:ribosome biogenesis ATPase [Microdochium nivale]